MSDLAPGDLVWVALDATACRERAGRRPALIVASADYLQAVDSLAIVVPITSVDRGWPNHVPIPARLVPQASWAMTEQVRTISRRQIVEKVGHVDGDTLAAVRAWVRDFLGL